MVWLELTQKDDEIEQYPTIQEELELLPSNVTNSKFLIMEPRNLKMAIMQLKTKNGHVIRDYLFAQVLRTSVPDVLIESPERWGQSPPR